jgi:hypothetical protein
MAKKDVLLAWKWDSFKSAFDIVDTWGIGTWDILGR